MHINKSYTVNYYHRGSKTLYCVRKVFIQYGYYKKDQHKVYYKYSSNSSLELPNGQSEMITDHPADIKQLDINSKRATGFVVYQEFDYYNYAGEVVDSRKGNGYLQYSSLKHMLETTQDDKFIYVNLDVLKYFLSDENPMFSPTYMGIDKRTTMDMVNIESIKLESNGLLVKCTFTEIKELLNMDTDPGQHHTLLDYIYEKAVTNYNQNNKRKFTEQTQT